MKKNLRKPMKSLMLTAMALLTATATAVNATSYVTIKVEHIWEDNNNAYGTRPDEVSVNISQVQGKDEEKNDIVTEENFTDISDNGSTAGAQAGADVADKSKEDLLEEVNQKGQEAGVQAGADAKDRLDTLGVTDPENLTKPGDLMNPDDLPKVEDLKDYTGEDGRQYQYSEDEKKAYQDKLDEYRKAYEAYQGSESEPGAYETYQEAYKNLLDYLKEYSKAENSASRPGGNDDGFMSGFLGSLGDSGLTADQLKEAYENGFNQGYDSGYSGGESAPEIKDDERDKLVAEIGDKIDQLVEGTGTDTAEEIIDTVNKIISGTETENKWFEEKRLEAGDEKNENGALNYRADMDNTPVEAKKDFLKDTLGLDDETLEGIGYTTTQLKIEITVVKGNNEEEPRVYVSVDGGKTFTGVNTDQEYNETADILEEVKFTFLHTLNVPYAPPAPEEIDEPEAPDSPKPAPKEEGGDDNSSDNSGGDTPTDSIPEEGVPLADVEEEPEESIPEEEVPLTDVPKTGDSSLIWMCAAMFSGTALLALLKKEREAREA